MSRYRYHILALMAILGALIIGSRKPSMVFHRDPALSLPPIRVQGQLEHGQELLPARTLAAVQASAPADMRSFILTHIESSLRQRDKAHALAIARAVITEANHHEMDPLFLLAVIQTESQFNPRARGRHGEIGLMQILPRTAKWLAPQAGLSVDQLNLEDPITNIRLGATFFAHLRKKFDGHGSRYLSAYNMGARNVRRLLAKNIEPAIYSSKVLENYRESREQFCSKTSEHHGFCNSTSDVSEAVTVPAAPSWTEVTVITSLALNR